MVCVWGGACTSQDAVLARSQQDRSRGLARTRSQGWWYADYTAEIKAAYANKTRLVEIMNYGPQPRQR